MYVGEPGGWHGDSYRDCRQLPGNLGAATLFTRLAPGCYVAC
jgi:hypothetical protein